MRVTTKNRANRLVNVALLSLAAIICVAPLLTLALHPSFFAAVVSLTAALGAVALCLTVSRSSFDSRVLVLLTVTAVAVPLYGFEAYLRLASSASASHPPDAVIRDNQGRTKREFITMLHRTDDKVVSAFSISVLHQSPNLRAAAQHWDVLPLAGVSHRMTVHCNEDGTWTSYHSDRYGFRNPDKLWDVPASVVVIGDSFTHGACVNDGDDYVSMLRERLPATLNLGVTGNGPLTELAILREYGSVAHPKTVIWAYYEGNEFRLINEETFSILARYRNTDFIQDLPKKQDRIDDLLDKAFQAEFAAGGVPESMPAEHSQEEIQIGHHETPSMGFWLSEVLGFVKLSQLRSLVGFTRPGRDYFEDYTSILMQAQKDTERWGGRLVLVYLPSQQTLAKRLDSSKREKVRMRSIAKTLGIDFIDVHEPMLRSEDPLGYFPKRKAYHYNKAGYRVVANCILNYFEQGDRR